MLKIKNQYVIILITMYNNFKSLPADVKLKFATNFLNDKLNNERAKRENVPITKLLNLYIKNEYKDEFIAGAFNWKNTPEGHDYWSDLNWSLINNQI